MALSEHQKKYLRRLGHDLHPIVRVGRQGLSANVITELGRALADHELVKVSARVGAREERNALLAELATASASELVQQIGNVGLFYKRNNKLSNVLIPDS